jgi:hypothetical protein
VTSLRDARRGTVLQVCHVVHDVEAHVDAWVRTFGAGPFFRATFQIDGHTYRGQPHRVNVHVAVGCIGSTIIELTQPADDAPSPFREVLECRGEGLHHYWIQAPSFDEEIARLGRGGCEYVSGGPLPRIGRAALIDTTRTLGCFTELIELNGLGWSLLDQIQVAHLGWDGRDPMRPYPAF